MLRFSSRRVAICLAALAMLVQTSAAPARAQEPSPPLQEVPPPVQVQGSPPVQEALPPTRNQGSLPPSAAPESLGDAVKSEVKGDIKALRRGPLLIHGNYCGIGNRPGTEPIDALDAACMRHDACTHTGRLPSCACDNGLREAATTIAQDPYTPADIQALATAMAASMVVLICK